MRSIDETSSDSPSPRLAEFGLLVATIVWGLSFTWAKHGGDEINRVSAAGQGAVLGPILLMSVRFFLAGWIWMAIFPAARKGWNWGTVGRSLLIGGFMGAGTITQVIGLDRTSEAVSAFLTSLTILWVPILLSLGLGKPPQAIFWVGVAIATAGIWLMTGAMPSGFGLGEMLGLATAFLFSFQIIATNAMIPNDDPFRITAGELIVSGGIGGLVCLGWIGFDSNVTIATATKALTQSDILRDLGLLIALPTLVSYGCMSLYQPKVDATRATLIYLLEPVAAATFAWLTVGRRLGRVEILGAGLILSANLLVEWVMSRRRRVQTP